MVSKTNFFSLATPNGYDIHPQDLYVKGLGNSQVSVTPEGYFGPHLDFGTWFNAAPTGWWKKLFVSGTLRLEIQGSGTLSIWSAKDGAKRLVLSQEIDGRLVKEVQLSECDDYLWPVLTKETGAKLQSLSWSLTSTRVQSQDPSARVTVVVPTYGREEDALNQVERMLGPDLKDTVARVLLIDQGGTVRENDRYNLIRETYGSRFEFFEQGNFGGSGGYARGMIESEKYPKDAVLLLDDDAVIEEESLRRAFKLSEALGRTTILGTGLISAEAPTQLESLAERITRRTFNWGASDSVGDGQDLSQGGPETWSFLSPHVPVDYTGWWGTLLPVGAVGKLGLPAPFFIKWDDAEYGLRAQRKGLRSFTLPGVSVWHPTWGAKGTSSSWSSWPMHRNRLAVAATYGAGRGVVLHSLLHQIKHILSLQYDTAELWNEGLKQFSRSPVWMQKDISETREVSQSFIDMLPKYEPIISTVTPPRSFGALKIISAFSFLVGNGVDGTSVESDAATYSWRDSLGVSQCILVGSSNSRVMRKDPPRARRLLRDSIMLHFRLGMRWEVQTKVYRSSHREYTSTWRRIF